MLVHVTHKVFPDPINMGKVGLNKIKTDFFIAGHGSTCDILIHASQRINTMCIFLTTHAST